MSYFILFINGVNVVEDGTNFDIYKRFHIFYTYILRDVRATRIYKPNECGFQSSDSRKLVDLYFEVCNEPLKLVCEQKLRIVIDKMCVRHIFIGKKIVTFSSHEEKTLRLAYYILIGAFCSINFNMVTTTENGK